jgi:hypothetical protein
LIFRTIYTFFFKYFERLSLTFRAAFSLGQTIWVALSYYRLHIAQGCIIGTIEGIYYDRISFHQFYLFYFLFTFISIWTLLIYQIIFTIIILFLIWLSRILLSNQCETNRPMTDWERIEMKKKNFLFIFLSLVAVYNISHTQL